MDNDQSTKGHARRRSASVLQSTALIEDRLRSNSTASGLSHSPKIPEAEDVREPRTGQPHSAGSSRESSSDWEMQDIYSDDGLEDDEETGLTDVDKRKRRKQKRRNTLLDERIAHDHVVETDEKNLAYQTLVKESAINALLIAMWYSFSIGISVFNKFVLSKDKLDFHYPLFFTSFHMIIQFSLAALVMYIIPSFRPNSNNSGSSQHYQAVSQSNNEDEIQPQPSTKQPIMTKFFYLTRISPCGAATGLDIGLGNMSLKFISLTFYTMCKSSVLGFVLIFAFLFRLERPSWKLAAIILTMAAGVVMMVAGETAFHALGFILIMTASCFSGFRWSLTQILLIRNPATSNPFSSIFFLAPVMFFTLIIIAFPVEGPVEFAAGFQRLIDARGLAQAIGVLLFPGLLAFLMTASEFALLKRTSVVTLSVCGIFKEVLTILTAAATFGDELTVINFSGLVVTILSIAVYNFIKFKSMKEEARKDAHDKVQRRQSILNTHERQKSVSHAGTETYNDNSTNNLIRNSLSVQRDGTDDTRKATTSHGDRSSPPTKRPEDLE
ncbi:triose-phosphate transporter family-domain-containing protein [Elsinoe ampelina]|uniref:Triose-phosphate transporter family-domain-containing protein n=1 Tax=Elsinoe ampelina TaxID=302913 RepID=A0A6A6GQ89_9PEZI|nr:triose-phosphate transporter family-domain-containing protein [Elsinoe ampelina]